MNDLAMLIFQPPEGSGVDEPIAYSADVQVSSLVVVSNPLRMDRIT